MNVLYDDLGILVWYSGVLRREADTVIICPGAGDLIGIDMTLAMPTSMAGIGLEEQMVEYGYAVSRGFDSEVDTDFFYQTYKDPNTSTCLEFPEQSEYTCE